jgi:predicted nucleic acid-binding protein
LVKEHKRVWIQRKPGISKSAPYWRGERAEQIIDKRVALYKLERGKRRSRKGKGLPRPKTLSQRLRRLERALLRRKTLAARQRIAQQIAQLKATLKQQGKNA